MYGNYYHLSPITGLHLLGSGHAPVAGDGGDEEDWEMRERDRFRSVPSIASLGLSAEINRRVSKRLKRRWGVFAYMATALQVIWQVRPFWVKIRWDDQSIEIKTLQITVANGRYYGSGLVIADDATIDDQMLDLQSVEIQHWWEMLPLLATAVRGKSVTGRGVRTIKGKDIQLYTRKPYPINTDGEQTTDTPARFRVIPQALSVFGASSFNR